MLLTSYSQGSYLPESYILIVYELSLRSHLWSGLFSFLNDRPITDGKEAVDVMYP